jgi:hypothetical protein
MKLYEAEKLFNKLKKQNPSMVFVVKMSRNGDFSVEEKDAELERIHDQTPEISNMKITDFLKKGK